MLTQPWTQPITLATLHPATVHFPIALLFFASIAALLYRGGMRRPELLTLTWWPMRVGWIGTWVAILTGLLAQQNLPPQPPYGSILNWHIGSGLAIGVVYGIVLYRQWLYRPHRRNPDRSSRTRQPNRSRTELENSGNTNPEEARPPADLLADPKASQWIVILLLLGMILVFASGWNGGRLVYEWGVNVGR